MAKKYDILLFFSLVIIISCPLLFIGLSIDFRGEFIEQPKEKITIHENGPWINGACIHFEENETHIVTFDCSDEEDVGKPIVFLNMIRLEAQKE